MFNHHIMEEPTYVRSVLDLRAIPSRSPASSEVEPEVCKRSSPLSQVAPSSGGARRGRLRRTASTGLVHHRAVAYEATAAVALVRVLFPAAGGLVDRAAHVARPSPYSSQSGCGW